MTNSEVEALGLHWDFTGRVPDELFEAIQKRVGETPVIFCFTAVADRIRLKIDSEVRWGIITELENGEGEST